jgi:hypothetical protein
MCFTVTFLVWPACWRVEKLYILLDYLLAESTLSLTARWFLRSSQILKRFEEISRDFKSQFHSSVTYHVSTYCNQICCNARWNLYDSCISRVSCVSPGWLQFCLHSARWVHIWWHVTWRHEACRVAVLSMSLWHRVALRTAQRTLSVGPVRPGLCNRCYNQSAQQQTQCSRNVRALQCITRKRLKRLGEWNVGIKMLEESCWYSGNKTQ